MKKWIILVVVVVLIAIAASASVYIVNEGEFVYITQFGAIRQIRTEAGLYLRTPFVQDVNRLTKKQMMYNVNESEVLTADKKAMIVDSFALWQIEDVTTFIRTVNNVPEMEKRIDATIYSVIKNLMGQLEQSEIITDGDGGRETLNKQVGDQVARVLTQYGIHVQSVEIKRYDLPSDNTEAVFTRMISERSQMAASYKADGEFEASKIRNETDKEISIMLGQARADAEKLRGEGEEEYMKILSDLYNDPDKADFYLFVRELEALETSLQGESTIILGPESPIARILSQR